LNTSRLLQQLKIDEGFRRFPYNDTVGILTIGYGRNLVAVGIGKAEAEVLLINDIGSAKEQISASFRDFNDLDDVRQEVLVNMTVNMGVKSLLGFRKLFAALRRHDYGHAAVEMLDSRWATQVGDRAKRLALAMKTGTV
jgi:lysozyme